MLLPERANTVPAGHLQRGHLLVSHWRLGASQSHGRAVHARRPMHCVGDPRPLDKHMHVRGLTYLRDCAKCGQGWWDGYELSTPHGVHAVVAAPQKVYLCPRCRGGACYIIVPGKWKF